MPFFVRESKNHFTTLCFTDFMCTQKYVKKRIVRMKEIRKLALLNQERIMSEYINKSDLRKVTNHPNTGRWSLYKK